MLVEKKCIEGHMAKPLCWRNAYRKARHSLRYDRSKKYIFTPDTSSPSFIALHFWNFIPDTIEIWVLSMTSNSNFDDYLVNQGILPHGLYAATLLDDEAQVDFHPEPANTNNQFLLSSEQS
jgi:hypothetical protein